MTDSYRALSLHPMALDATCFRPTGRVTTRVQIDSPATAVMTDLTRVNAVTIDPGATIDEANQYMIRRGVRLLLVTDPRETIVGLIDAAAILGPQPLLAARERSIGRADVLVRDIMTRTADLEVARYEEITAAKVGHVVQTLRTLGRQHLLVADRDPRGRDRVRGIISLSQVARQLGVDLQAAEFAHTFAQIESALGA